MTHKALALGLGLLASQLSSLEYKINRFASYQFSKLPPKTANTIRLMSFNVRYINKIDPKEFQWATRLPLILEMLDYYQPDIIGLQEPKLIQVNNIFKALMKKNYRWFGKPRRPESLYNPIFYDTTRLILKRYDTFWLNENNIKYMPGWDLNVPRTCTWGKFILASDTDKNFFVFNTHLPDASEQERSRVQSAHHQLKTIAQEIKPQDLLFLMGDFNYDVSDKLIKEKILPSSILELFDTKSLVSSLDNIIGPKTTYYGWLTSKTFNIDYILVNHPKKIIVKRYEVIVRKDQKLLSDHRPIVVDIEIL